MKENLRIVVLAKQVPDTRNVGKDAMTPEGTVNRAALPAIFNPEDLNALEQALRVKDQHKSAEIILLTMGPGRAADIIREAIFRGADKGILLSDRKFAGSDTLATSYALSLAIKQINQDLIFAGRQAIDGDTAQVGPQVAEKLGIPQVTYSEEVMSLNETGITIKRRLERGIEIVKSTLPVLITVHATAAECRPRNAKQVLKFKYARTESEDNLPDKTFKLSLQEHPYLQIAEWTAANIGGDDNSFGLSGSPTKVKKIENIVFQAKEAKKLTASDADIDGLIVELLSNHTIG